MVERAAVNTRKSEKVTLSRLRTFIEGGPKSHPNIRREAVRDWLAIQWVQAQESISTMLVGEGEKAAVWSQMIKGLDSAITERELDPETGVWYLNARETFQKEYFPFFLKEAEKAVPGMKGRRLLAEHERRIWAVEKVTEMYPPIAGKPLQ